MGDSKSKKTMTKLGKLFGVSQTNLHQMNSPVYEDPKQAANGAHGNDTQTGGLRKASPFSSKEDIIAGGQEEDGASPMQRNNMLYGINSNNSKNNSNEPNSNIKNDGNLSTGIGTNNQNTNGSIQMANNKGKGTTSRLLVVSPRTGSKTNISTINNPNRIASPAHSVNSLEDNILFHPQPQAVSSMASDFNLHSGSSTNLPTISSPSPMHIRSPTMSVSSTNTNQPTKKTPSSAGGKSNPVSRTSSLKTKPVALKDKDLNSSLVSPSPTPAKPRFRMLENGLHEHNLRSAKRQEKLSNMLKGLLGSKKLRDEAISAVPNILQTPQQSNSQLPQANDKPPTLFAGLVHQVKNNTSPYHGTVNGIGEQPDCRSFVEKYGRCQEVIGKGSFGVVRISHKKVIGQNSDTEEKLYAVKEFKRRPNESDKKYNRRLTSEFCISSSLKNMNIINTLDLLKDAKGDYCEVMEFCSGGDLYTLIIASGKLEYAEADCFFKQLIRGVNYMHEMGVSHRDLKPENLLLTQNGILKITDFGNGECFKMAWENEIQYSEGVCGSSPYIAPEEFSQHSFDPRGVDIWACGVIYMAMRTGRQLWKLADPKKDEFFEEYLMKRKDASGYEPIESLKRARCRNVIYSILDPKPERRINGKQILNSEWGREIKVCDAGEGKSDSQPPPEI
mmetsp:Transcript_6833/g.6756  ORF Transcript_6833/g.6756 Transcript_6833/m.6756 type:complete len:672 (-) Transcript_6833:628-2643(-)